MLSESARQTPLRRNVSIEEVEMRPLCSDMASGIAGEILYVDGGFNISGMAPLDEGQE